MIQNVKGRFCAIFGKTSFLKNGKVLKNINCWGKTVPSQRYKTPMLPPLLAAAAAVCVVGVRFVHVCVRMVALCKALFDVHQDRLPLARDHRLAG